MNRNIVPSDRQDKGELVRDLYFNERKSYHEIAKLARVSLRDIKGYLNEDARGSREERQMSESSKAYKLLYEGKTPLDVAIALNLGGDKVNQYYKEFWELQQLHDFNIIYLETRGELGSFVKLYKLSKAAGLDSEHVLRLLTISNNHLPSLEHKFETLKAGLNSVEYEKQKSERVLQDLNNQVTNLRNNAGYYQAACLQEEKKFEGLQLKRIKLEALLKQFENNNEEYLRIRKTVEENVISTLSNGKGLVQLALLSLMESIRKDPEKYNSLICYDMPSMMAYSSSQFLFYGDSLDMHQQEQHRSKEDYMDMLVEEAAKLYDKLKEELADEIISNYNFAKSLPSLSYIPPSDRD